MNIESKLDQLLVGSPVIEIPTCRTGRDDSFKGLFVSDLHMGIGDKADDFRPNAELFIKTISDHIAKGFRIFVLGDIYELWENPNFDEIQNAYPDIFDLLVFKTDLIRGNHDQHLILPQSYVLIYKETGKKILLVHGHQGDFFCNEGYPLGWFFVRHVWRRLQMIGFKDPTTAREDKNPEKHERTRAAFYGWSQSREQTVIFGHTHFAESDPPYFWNCGSWVGKGGQGVVVEGEEISLKIF